LWIVLCLTLLGVIAALLWKLFVLSRFEVVVRHLAGSIDGADGAGGEDFEALLQLLSSETAMPMAFVGEAFRSKFSDKLDSVMTTTFVHNGKLANNFVVCHFLFGQGFWCSSFIY